MKIDKTTSNYNNAWKNAITDLLDNLDDPFNKFVLEYVDKHAFFNVRSFRKYYANKFNVDKFDRTIHIKIARITYALKNTYLIAKWSCNSYKNLCRGKIIENLRIMKYQNDLTPELE